MTIPFDTIHRMSIKQVIDRQADHYPDHIYLVIPDETNPEDNSGKSLEITYAELRYHAQAIAARIACYGIKPGETVAYAMENGIHATLCLMGLYYGGYHATAINLVAGKDTISYILDHSRSQLVLVQEQTKALISQALDDQAISPVMVQVDDDFLNLTWCPLETPTVESSNDALLMYTSGTTGRPKGVVLTHGNLLAGGANTALSHQLGQQDRALCVLPLFHINGVCVTLMAPLVCGGSVVMPRRFSASRFWNILLNYKCSWFSVVPTHISYLLHEARINKKSGNICTQNVRFGRSASAPLSPEIQNEFEQYFGIPIIETMGLTETAAQILSNPLPPATRKIGSAGMAFGNEVIIADAQHNEVPRGTEGEILVRGHNVMRLYLRNDKATRESLTPQGWLCTGDLGRMDAEGYVFITGRLKELIIKGGENIAPREVDEALIAHPDVIEAAAFACVCKNYGQRIEAGVVLSPGVTVSEQELIRACVQKIGTFKAPDRVHFLSVLPKGPSGKVQRLKIADHVSKLRSSS